MGKYSLLLSFNKLMSYLLRFDFYDEPYLIKFEFIDLSGYFYLLYSFYFYFDVLLCGLS